MSVLTLNKGREERSWSIYTKAKAPSFKSLLSHRRSCGRRRGRVGGINTTRTGKRAGHGALATNLPRPSIDSSFPSFLRVNVVACFETSCFVTPPSGRYPNHFIRLHGALHDPTLHNRCGQRWLASLRRSGHAHHYHCSRRPGKEGSKRSSCPEVVVGITSLVQSDTSFNIHPSVYKAHQLS